VICFLRWHNLKESPQERISFPLLLLPVELTRKKGVRDAYVSNRFSSEAEVNPALRHHLRQLYGLNLGESTSLRPRSMRSMHCSRNRSCSEPGVVLNKLERRRLN